MEYFIETKKAQEFIDITNLVKKVIDESGLNNGIAVIFVPHTTAGVTINESADPDVVTDILSAFDKTFPEEDDYLHIEGNSHAHIKATVVGSSCNIIIENGKMKLGTWQGIYFCEFDGPRKRKVYIKTIGN